MAEPSDQIDRSEGRALFGRDAAGYERARPAYPARVFEALAERCGLGPGTTVLEVGAGTGLATLPLLAAGARVTAVEPDAEMAARLRANAGREGHELTVATTPFEDYEPGAGEPPSTATTGGGFDLGVAATSFHWVDPEAGLAKAHSLLRPGGCWAMWWNVFMDDTRPDPFHAATTPILRPLGPVTGTVRGRPPFALDRERREAELRAAGFTQIEVETIASTLRLTTAQVRDLYASFSIVIALPAAEREAVLDALAAIADESFGGIVERPFQTALYTARRPAARR